MINKIKEWLARAAVVIYTFFTERVSPFFEKIGAAFRRMVIIDGDVYITQKRTKRNGKTPRVFSLYFGLVGTILIGAFLAVAVFLGTKAAAEYYITTFYLSEEKREEREAVRSAVAALAPRERELIELRYGLCGGEELTQKEVADRMGISQSYISRLEKRIIAKLKKEILAST